MWERAEVGLAFQPKIDEQMSCVVGKPVDARGAPSIAEQVDGQRKAVHLREQGDDKAENMPHSVRQSCL